MHKVNFEEVSDGRKYSSNDLVKADCGGCKGCSDCCRMVDTILLDPYDIYLLENKLGRDFAGLMNQGVVELNVHEGLIFPNLCSNPETGKCSLLSIEGWCQIHEARPGFCRLFPLGRIYGEDGSFEYFLQVHECPYPNKTKVKVSKWLGIPDLKSYEAYIRAWHQVQESLTAQCGAAEADLAKKINMGFLQLFYMTAYDVDRDFYEQFYKRLEVLN